MRIVCCQDNGPVKSNSEGQRVARHPLLFTVVITAIQTTNGSNEASSLGVLQPPTKLKAQAASDMHEVSQQQIAKAVMPMRPACLTMEAPLPTSSKSSASKQPVCNTGPAMHQVLEANTFAAMPAATLHGRALFCMHSHVSNVALPENCNGNLSLATVACKS